MGELKKWRDQKWVRVGTDGEIKGACGTSKNKKNPDRCLPLAKAKRLTKRQRAATARKKKVSLEEDFFPWKCLQKTLFPLFWEFFNFRKHLKIYFIP